jgi:hypothetical protein
MAFDYTNFLETAAQANNGDFTFTNRTGSASTVRTANTSGEWCEEVSSTASNSTGASTSPPGRAGFIYTETSSPSTYTDFTITRATSLDSTTQNITLNLLYNINVTDAVMHIEYATVASPTSGDWTTVDTVPSGTDTWIQGSWDFSSISTPTLWLRVRTEALASNFTNDVCISTWNEVGVDSVLTETTHFRIQNDDGTESGASWADNEDTKATINTAASFRVRVQIDTTIGGMGAKTVTLQVRESTDPDWADVI